VFLTYYNNPTSCSCAQSISFHCSFTLHVSGAFHTHHQEYINCIYSLWYRSYIAAASFLQRGRVWTDVPVLLKFIGPCILKPNRCTRFTNLFIFE